MVESKLSNMERNSKHFKAWLIKTIIIVYQSMSSGIAKINDVFFFFSWFMRVTLGPMFLCKANAEFINNVSSSMAPSPLQWSSCLKPELFPLHFNGLDLFNLLYVALNPVPLAFRCIMNIWWWWLWLHRRYFSVHRNMKEYSKLFNASDKITQ